MRYVPANRDVPFNQREYDACYYEVIMSEGITEDTRYNMSKNANGAPVKLYLEIVSAKNITVFVYIGRSRSSSYENATF